MSHQLQIWKQAGTIRFMLDRVCRYEAIAPVGYAFMQLSQGDGAQYKGTILQHLTAL
ncbi:hypothetical protein [Anoxybacteroides tepidamans]|uniref:hypothetical protein n=1 Tax=Anoxybacteroides tepidamans TaxID=265948 RepID=UPI000AE0DC23|nr:hypothetical protein [Anoxybacillus tepidamans]